MGVFVDILLGVVFKPFRKILPINNNLWVFGSDEGMRYGQNSRYLYEYVMSHDKSINAIWITKSKDVYNRLKDENKPVVINSSIKGIWYSLTAKVKIVSNWFSDIDYTFYDKRQKVAYLEHGMPIKKIFYDYIPKIKEEHSRSSKIKGAIYKFFIGNYKLDYSCFTPVTSELYKHILSGAMHNNRVYICGQPRTDVLLHLDGNDIKRRLGIRKEEFIVTYMPTHRSYGLGEPCPKIFFNNEAAVDFFKSNNILVIIKQHPNMLSKYSLTEADNCFKDLSFDKTIDTQELLFITDLLITDFSSCFIDYLVFNRPILFYNYDEYEKTDNDLYVSIEDLKMVGDMCYDEHTLFEEVKDIILNTNSKPSNSSYFSEFQDDKSCERCYKKLLEIANS